jgi:predicted MPP superfamily phosphohydrolase
MFVVFLFVFLLFILFRFVALLNVGRGWKIAIAALIFAGGLQPFVTRTIASATTWDLPSGLVVFQGLLLAVLLFLTIFVLLRDICGLCIWAISKKYPSHFFASNALALGMCATALLISVVGIWQSFRVPDIRKVEITIDKLPKGLDGFTIVQLTDLHITKVFSEKWVKEVVDKCNALEPDIILLTGDIADGRPENRLPDLAPLGNLKAGLGLYGVPGNHEYFAGHYWGWMDAYKGLGIRMLLNEHEVLSHNGYSLVLAGITDTNASRIANSGASRIAAPMPDLTAALDGAPEGLMKILMSHRPENARESADAGIDLQLSGHTHGGQMVGLHLIANYAFNGFTSGLYHVDNMWLYVSNGAGVSTAFPIRLGRPSEITQIVLRAGDFKTHSNRHIGLTKQ